jgi:tetratricopeptide (TPR) repeat protein
VNVRRLLLVAALVTFPSVARADDRAEAKNFFKAGAAAYSAGDYLAAIQALDAAYRLTPLPAIAFSLAQAERRQYFVSREPPHLVRAIELYRTYLAAVPSGGRRADATDALGQLEPLAVGLVVSPATEAPSPNPRESAKTRLMVSSEAPQATVSLDGALPVPSPLIAEVTAGDHRVEVSATGYFTIERRLVAIAGELVPMEVELQERPAVVFVEPSSQADLYVDGAYLGKVQKGARVELPAGTHQFAFAKKGRRLESMMVTLERGSTRHLPVDLHWTSQRMTAVSLFVVSGATLIGGLGLAGAAAEREEAAQKIYSKGDTRPLTESELDDYEEAVEQRNRYRASAIGSLAVSLGSVITGMFLFELDEPNVREELPRSHVDRSKPSLKVEGSVAPSPHGLELGARVTF